MWAAVPAQPEPGPDRPPELGAIGLRAGESGELVGWLFRADYSQYAAEQVPRTSESCPMRAALPGARGEEAGCG